MQWILGIIVSGSVFLAVPTTAIAQSDDLPLPKLEFCDPLLNTGADEAEDEGDEDVLLTRKRRYDLEQSEFLESEQAIMDALYEEKWDLNTGQSIPRTDLCASEPNYLIHWAELTSKNEQGEIVVLAEGTFRFQKDKTFEYVYKDRPYYGTWGISDFWIWLKADWLNEGEPIVAKVEMVRTPVEVTYSDGETESYIDEVFRIGWFRFTRIETTEKGKIHDCAC
ncbi:MAG: hypothetical protein QNJ16_01615 [Rhodobacter sp.]|nr:hypothetical protein [Rhodobacter sp.]